MTLRLGLLAAGFGGLFLTGVLGFLLVPLLTKVNFVQTIRNNGPAWHSDKNGTPTMGGLMLIIGSLVALLLPYLVLTKQVPEMNEAHWQQAGKGMMIAILFAVANGAIGFFDDFIKVIKKHNKGFSIIPKLLLQMVVVAVFLIALQQNAMLTTVIQLPFLGMIDLGFFFYPLSYILILVVINGVNFTDGIDGLATSVTFLVMIGYLVICSFLGWYDLGLFSAALAGSCTGFLVWNFHPAKIFMGDTGSLFFGGAVAGIAFCMGHPELLFILGFIYLVEAMSVLLQVIWFRISKGKRLFKMTPLHHHFELSGWSEVKITTWFSVVMVVCVGLAFLFAYSTY